MNDYTEFQSGWLIFVLMIPFQILLTYLYMYDIGDRPIDAAFFTIINSVFFLIYLLFYGLTTKMSSQKITVSFGIGLIRKRIELKRIRTVETVDNPWYYGWGIRFIPNGMLYNISGSQGVEIKFSDTERVIRIGSKDPARLRQEIVRRMK